LIGYGNIGKKVGELASALGMEIEFVNSQSPPGQLESLLIDSDIISLHLPLTARSYHLINAKCFKLMKPSAYLINTARGALVNTTDLINALQSRQIAGAAIECGAGSPSIRIGCRGR